MALSTKEKTSKKVLNSFKISGLSPDYINLGSVTFVNNGDITAELNIYGDKEARDNEDIIKQELTNIIIPKKLQDEIKGFLFGKLYPYLEKTILFKEDIK